MKQHGALFTKDNRLAIRADRKTMTRRIPDSFKAINEHPDEWEFMGYMWSHSKGKVKAFEGVFKRNDKELHIRILWQVNDELYIREPLTIDSEGMYYRDDDMSIPESKILSNTDWIIQHWGYKPDNFVVSSRFMPKWAAREWLRVDDVKVERLQSIDELDALNEGTPERFFDFLHGDMKTSAGTVKGPFLTGGAVNAYRKQWEEINGEKHPWKRNEWVVAYTFKRIKL